MKWTLVATLAASAVGVAITFATQDSPAPRVGVTLSTGWTITTNGQDISIAGTTGAIRPVGAQDALIVDVQNSGSASTTLRSIKITCAGVPKCGVALMRMSGDDGIPKLLEPGSDTEYSIPLTCDHSLLLKDSSQRSLEVTAAVILSEGTSPATVPVEVTPVSKAAIASCMLANPQQAQPTPVSS
jgi:hypothetical protein